MSSHARGSQWKLGVLHITFSSSLIHCATLPLHVLSLLLLFARPHTSTASGADGKRRLIGDVDFDGVSQVAGAISPVPGGVGPLTVAGLLMNTVDAYQQHMTADIQRVTSNM